MGLGPAILILIVIIIRMGIHHSLLQGTDLSVKSRRRWAATLRDILLVIFILGIWFIWLHKIQTFAVPLLAVALALVLATKEIITCISGSILRMVTKAFSLGDRIEIGGIRGNVRDHLAIHLINIREGLWSFPTALFLIIPLKKFLAQFHFAPRFALPDLTHVPETSISSQSQLILSK